VTYDIACQVGYSILVSAPNFEMNTVLLEPVKSGEKTTEISLEPVSVIITDTEVILNPIYFDFNKSHITAQGASELDKLVKVMKDYPKMVIFVKSHTDSKGGLEYNLVLSEQRAQSTVQYLISKGISGARITGKGFGSSELKIKCGTKCTEEEHAQNRRSEFLIVKK
jgi:outer membrane protein OmpA-like peptidoglycan-associated protein